MTILRKIVDTICFWFSRTTTFWVTIDKLNNIILRDSFAIFDRDLSAKEIANLYTAGVLVDDKDWHYIVIVFRRFGKQEFYLDGNQVNNASFS